MVFYSKQTKQCLTLVCILQNCISSVFLRRLILRVYTMIKTASLPKRHTLKKGIRMALFVDVGGRHQAGANQTQILVPWFILRKVRGDFK